MNKELSFESEYRRTLGENETLSRKLKELVEVSRKFQELNSQLLSMNESLEIEIGQLREGEL
jgi:hypothetical protein